MILALIHWRIKPDEKSISDFLTFWREQATVNDRGGLVAEFLSEVAKLTDYPYITWHLDPDHLGSFKSFVNVGIWNDEKAFHDQVAKNFNDDRRAKKATVEGSLVLTASSLVRKKALVPGGRTSGSFGLDSWRRRRAARDHRLRRGPHGPREWMASASLSKERGSGGLQGLA